MSQSTGVNEDAGYPAMEWAQTLDIPLKASEELVSIDLATDLPEDPADLRTLLVEENSDKEHWLTIAVAYFQQGKHQESIQLVTMALEVFSAAEKGSLYTFLSWAYLNLAKHNNDPKVKDQLLSKAEDSLKDAIGSDPTWVGNMLATIDLYYQRGHYDKALETADLFIKSIQAEERRAGKQSKVNSMFLLMRAKLLYQKKNYMGSLKLFQELLVINPVLRPDPRIGIGLCFWQLKDYKMAIQSWSRSLELNPNNSNIKILLLLGKFHNSIINSQNDDIFKANLTEALNDLNTLFDQNNENPVLLTLLQHYYFFKKDYTKVIKIYESKILPKKNIIVDKVLSESMFWCARAYYSQDDYRKAFTMFQESLRKNEDNLLARFGIGQSQIKTNLIEESILTFENLYKSNENIQELNYILGLLYAGKCLNINPLHSKVPSKEIKSTVNKALQFLEKYVNLTTAKKNQLVITRAYLVISELYELQNQYKKSLDMLSKATEELSFMKSDNNTMPLEIINNLGCFHFINGDLDKAKEYFTQAKECTSKDKTLESFDITIDYNLARSTENDNIQESEMTYEKILSAHPNYISAKIRNIFCKFVNEKTNNGDRSLMAEVSELVEKHGNNLEVRSFYGWFLKNDETNPKKENDALLTSHSRDTLVKYDSHDLYALISLANLYSIIARESNRSPSSKEHEKAKHSYLKALQLYQKVLQIDPLNVFAAQGIAIIFAESKRLGPALEILRKVRDSINNEDVHVNLAHALLEIKEYTKAAEAYEIVLKKFPNIKNKAYILNMLGRVWYSRGMKEKDVHWLIKSLNNIMLAIEATEIKPQSENFLNGLKFNSALLQFQIAETLRRSNIKARSVKSLSEALIGLNEAVVTLKSLRDSDKFKIVSKEEIEQRIQLGETTMKSSLERSIAEQETFEKEQNEKLESARKSLEAKELEAREKIAKEREAEELKMKEKAKEYKKLQDEAQKLIQERDIDMVNESDGDFSDKNKDEGEKKPKKRKRSSTKKKNKSEQLNSSSESDEEEEDITVKKRSKIPTGKKSSLSNEFIEDSDEEAQMSNDDEDDEDGLF